MGFKAVTGTAMTFSGVTTLALCPMNFTASFAVVHPTSLILVLCALPCSACSFLVNAHTSTCSTVPLGFLSDVTGIIMCLLAHAPLTADTMTDTAIFPLAALTT